MKILTIKTPFGSIEGISYPATSKVVFYLDCFRAFDLSSLGLSTKATARIVKAERKLIKAKLANLAYRKGYKLSEGRHDHIVSFVKA
jgi:hypothetical protein